MAPAKLCFEVWQLFQILNTKIYGVILTVA